MSTPWQFFNLFNDGLNNETITRIKTLVTKQTLFLFIEKKSQIKYGSYTSTVCEQKI